MKRRTLEIACLAAWGLIVLIGGCAQNTETPVQTRADTLTPSDQGQLQDQFGNSVREPNQRLVSIGVVEHMHIHSPFSNDAPVPEDLLLACAESAQMGPAGTAQTEGSDATHTMTTDAISVTVTQSVTAGTEMQAAQTATQTPGVSTTQTPSATITPTQSPETSLAVDVPIAWAGGLASGAANAAQGGDATQTKSDTNTVRWLQTLAECLKDPDFVEAVNRLMSGEAEPAKAEEPTTQPSGE
ncbi:MAG TPA: hypothetical protein VM243_08475 [Phycisphaerae bacterium]|nr:hypothetical protein [Phycisphaerae bacterium]